MTRAIFLDDGGVLSDNERRHEHWTRLAGEYLARELGGDPARWGEANRYAAARLMARLEDPRNRAGSSGATKADLDGYLRAEGTRDLFGTRYGVDVVDVWKDGPGFYAAAFEHARVRPDDAVVVDDKLHNVESARVAGARAFLLDRGGGPGQADALRSLDELVTKL